MKVQSHRGSGRKSVVSVLNKRQKQLGLGNDSQCLPSSERNTGIEDEILTSLRAAVLLKIQFIHEIGFISEEMTQEAKEIAQTIESLGIAALYRTRFIKCAMAIAILSFQSGGYTAYGMHFEEVLCR